MTTIYDLARKTGISKSTISRVVSGNGYVSEDKRKIILDAMHEMNYVPNQVAKDLRKKRTNTIGFLVSEYFPFVGDFLNSFTKIAAEHGYSVNVYFTQTADNELKALRLLTTHALDAIFILTRINSWDTISSYAKFGPISTWHRVNRPNIYSNFIDHYPIYLQVLNHLYKSGHKDIGHVLSGLRNANTRARVRAIDDFVTAHPDSNQSFQLFYHTQMKTGEDVAKKWLDNPNHPTTVIFYDDFVAAEFISTLRKNGKKVPEDCLVVGSNNSEIAKIMNIPTIDLCFKNQAHNAFIYLYNELNSAQLPYETQNPHWVDAY
ncbi:MAG TPA: LacI family DNA-binding transcriptional regulator [Candidatus Companilactobacillus pullicola]|uniref:LacI family DNA-binding transcriptional regulator n=1 Tax=Candidatus Companilactobacillus pullicola TaxID=2838523 RepID=A0A9D2CPH7_9LACO|nr:LacI family DNA-binding transcriptional regulator [Candidatus Companilactobacillus pullicola]